MRQFAFESKFDIGEIVQYNAPFTGSVKPRFKIMAVLVQFDGSTVYISYKVRQLFDHLEYERREGISQSDMLLLEHELVSI